MRPLALLLARVALTLDALSTSLLRLAMRLSGQRVESEAERDTLPAPAPIAKCEPLAAIRIGDESATTTIVFGRRGELAEVRVPAELTVAKEWYRA